MTKAKPKTGPRPWTADYGPTQGHCATKKSCLKRALCAAVDGLNRITLEDPNGRAFARVNRVGDIGIFVEDVRKGTSRIVHGANVVHFKRKRA